MFGRFWQIFPSLSSSGCSRVLSTTDQSRVSRRRETAGQTRFGGQHQAALVAGRRGSEMDREAIDHDGGTYLFNNGF
jgi:hypothetical protein